MQAMASEPVLIYDKRAHVAQITLNRPDVLNAVNLSMRDALWEALLAFRDDPDAHALLLSGAGDRAFSAGADIGEFGTAPSYVEARRARHDRDVWGLMLAITKPLVAAIHGFAYGAGCEMALCCDIRVAADDARFALPEVKLGYMPSAGGTQTLPRTIPPGVARGMIFAAEPIDAARALDLGLLHRVVSRDELIATASALALRLAQRAQPPLRAVKEAMLRGADVTLEDALRIEATIAARLASNTHA